MTALRYLFAGLVFSIAVCGMELAHSREAGWVPVPQTKPMPQTAKKRPAPPRASEQSGATIRDSGLTVYEKQPPVTEKEVSAFVDLLPRFRRWARQNSEEAHPVLTPDGKPDFLYSPHAGQWVQKNGFEPARFFCVMGKMAAALVIVEEGNDFKGTRPPDMPEVSAQELDLARRHLGELLAAGGQPGSINGD